MEAPWQVSSRIKLDDETNQDSKLPMKIFTAVSFCANILGLLRHVFKEIG